MHCGYTIVHVADVLASVKFYEQALGLTRRFVHESGHYAEFETGTTTLAFAGNAMAGVNGLDIRPNAPAELPAGIELAFVTEDPEGALLRATGAGAVLVKPVTEKRYSGRWCRDDAACAVARCCNRVDAHRVGRGRNGADLRYDVARLPADVRSNQRPTVAPRRTSAVMMRVPKSTTPASAMTGAVMGWFHAPVPLGCDQGSTPARRSTCRWHSSCFAR